MSVICTIAYNLCTPLSVNKEQRDGYCASLPPSSQLSATGEEGAKDLNACFGVFWTCTRHYATIGPATGIHIMRPNGKCFASVADRVSELAGQSMGIRRRLAEEGKPPIRAGGGGQPSDANVLGGARPPCRRRRCRRKNAPRDRGA